MTRPEQDAPSPSAALPALLNSLNELRAFVAVAESGSFSRAAEQLAISQPSVSQRVRALEALYGLKLLERRSGVTLTAAGHELFTAARLLLARADEFDNLALDLGQLRRGRLTLGFSTPGFAMPLVARLQASHPALRVTFRHGNTAQLLEALHGCRIDVGVMTVAQPAAGLEARLIARQGLAACVVAAHGRAARASFGLPDLGRERVIVRESGSMTRQLLDQACADAGVALRDPLIVPTREALKEAVAAGLGIGVLLDGELGADPRLRQVPIRAALPPGVGTYALALGESAAVPAVAAFLELCAGA